MSPNAFIYFLVASLLLQLASSALRIQNCVYEDGGNPKVVKDAGYPACLVKYDVTQEDLLFDKNANLKNQMKILIFPHRDPKIIQSPTAVHYECGACEGCRQYLSECTIQSTEHSICGSLYLESTSEMCVVKTNNNRQFMINPNKFGWSLSIDPQAGGVVAKNISREKRYTKKCSFPNALETAQINCRLYPKKVRCIERCAFGYTLDKGIRQKMECNYKENVWKPKGFRECRPFVDCTLTMVSPGNANCTSMSLESKPSCRVTCLEYEDKEAVPETVYECDIEGKWDPPLPFCATPGTGMALAKAPKKKLHHDEEKGLE